MEIYYAPEKKQELQMILISLDRFFLVLYGFGFYSCRLLVFYLPFPLYNCQSASYTKNQSYCHICDVCVMWPQLEEKRWTQPFSSRFTTPLNTEVTFQKLFLGSLVCHWHLPQTFSRLPQKYQAILKHHTHTHSLWGWCYQNQVLL